MCSAPSVVVVAMLARDLLGTGAVLFVAVIAAPPRCCRGMCGTSKPRFIDDFNQRWAGVTLTNCMSVILLPRSLQSFGNMFNWNREGSGEG